MLINTGQYLPIRFGYRRPNPIDAHARRMLLQHISRQGIDKPVNLSRFMGDSGLRSQVTAKSLYKFAKDIVAFTTQDTGQPMQGIRSRSSQRRISARSIPLRKSSIRYLAARRDQGDFSNGASLNALIGDPRLRGEIYKNYTFLAKACLRLGIPVGPDRKSRSV